MAILSVSSSFFLSFFFMEMRMSHFQRQNFDSCNSSATPQSMQFLFLGKMLSFSFFLLLFLPPVSDWVLTQPHTLPNHARTQPYATHPPTLSHMRYAFFFFAGLPAPTCCGAADAAFFGGEGKAGGWVAGRVVRGDEPGSSALSPAIHIRWVHSHTRLIAWPIQGGSALSRWRPLWSEDCRVVMVLWSP